MTTDFAAAQDQLTKILASFQTTPYDAVDNALGAQLKAVDDWSATVRDQQVLVAMAGLLKAQIQASQRMLDVTRRESEAVAGAMRQAARAAGMPAV